MVRSRDRSGKRKATSPDAMAPSEVDVAALRQHNRAAGERRSKAREDARSMPPSRSRAQVRRLSPPPKRSRVIQVSTSDDEASEGAHSEGSRGRGQSWRYESFFAFEFLFLVRLQHLGEMRCRFLGLGQSLHP